MSDNRSTIKRVMRQWFPDLSIWIVPIAYKGTTAVTHICSTPTGRPFSTTCNCPKSPRRSTVVNCHKPTLNILNHVRKLHKPPCYYILTTIPQKHETLPRHGFLHHPSYYCGTTPEPSSGRGSTENTTDRGHVRHR